MRILIAGTTGDSMPPPYGGIPKLSLLYGRTWIKWGHQVAISFVFKPKNADDRGANAEYFFEYKTKPDKFKKLLFLLKYFFKNPFLYFKLLKSYLRIAPHISKEALLYTSYGVFMDGVIASFKPDIILGEAVLVKTFMLAELAKMRHIPIVYDTYAEVGDPLMGVNKHLDEAGKKKYWTYFLNMAEIVVCINNCAAGSLKYLPKEKVKVFYDTCEFDFYGNDIPGSKNDFRDDLKLPHDLFLIGAVGAFEFRKGHDHLIKAVGILNRAGHKDIGAAICGGSGDETKWKELAKEEGVGDKVFFFKRIPEDDLKKLHRCLDLYSNLSYTPRSCGLDLALLEAMASALPIIVYNYGGLPAAVPEGDNGYLVEANNIEKVSEKIIEAYKLTPEQRREMGLKSRALAKKCDINSTAEIKLNWFKEIVLKHKV